MADVPKSWFVYVIANGRGRTYVGVTRDVSPDRRVAEHNGTSKGAKSTKGNGPWFLVYAETHRDASTAMSREWHLKRDRRLRRIVSEGALGLVDAA